MTTKISGDNISAIANQGVNWNAVTVADGSTQLNALAGNGYLLDTNTGVIEVFLPASPTRGDTVILSDYAGTFATNNVIVNSGANNIDSTVGSEFILSTNNRIAEFVYIDSNKGWLYKGATTKGSTPSQAGLPQYDNDPDYVLATGGTIATVGDYKIHTFTGDGCFVVSPGGNQFGNNIVDYLVIAGGGGANDTGGGGAGGYRESKQACAPWTASPLATSTGITVTTQTYPITVGGGGNTGSAGATSTFSTITSAGGGVGAHGNSGQPGGSGGGAGYGSGTGGAGNTPPVSPPQGQPGGDAPAPQVSPFRGAGGGGAGTSGSNQPGGPGGNGVTTTITNTPTTYAGGGGGAAGGAGGSGGGGDAGAHPTQDQVNGEPGTANTGGGGGAASGLPSRGSGGQGGKGLVVIRYKFQN